MSNAKKFMFGVFVWFLAQFLYLSIGVNLTSFDHASQHATKQQIEAECLRGVNSFVVVFHSLLVPITRFTFIDGDQCWNTFDAE